MIDFKDVCKTYKDYPVIQHFNLKIYKGELVVLVGESGCGKTTLLKMINKLTSVSSGEIEVDGININTWDTLTLRRKIGYVVQQRGLFPHLTVKENIQLLPNLMKEDKKKLDEKTNQLLRLVNLDPEIYGNRYPAQLSGGEEQRVGVARALVTDPEIILMDEPFSALDPMTRCDLQNELLNIQRKLQKTIIFVTHDMDEAIKLADAICIVQNGELLQYDTRDRILQHPNGSYVEHFIGKAKEKSEVAFKAAISQLKTLEINELKENLAKQKMFILLDEDNKPLAKVEGEVLQRLMGDVTQKGRDDE